MFINFIMFIINHYREFKATRNFIEITPDYIIYLIKIYIIVFLIFIWKYGLLILIMRYRQSLLYINIIYPINSIYVQVRLMFVLVISIYLLTIIVSFYKKFRQDSNVININHLNLLNILNYNQQPLLSINNKQVENYENNQPFISWFVLENELMQKTLANLILYYFQEFFAFFKSILFGIADLIDKLEHDLLLYYFARRTFISNYLFFVLEKTRFISNIVYLCTFAYINFIISLLIFISRILIILVLYYEVIFLNKIYLTLKLLPLMFIYLLLELFIKFCFYYCFYNIKYITEYQLNINENNIKMDETLYKLGKNKFIFDIQAEFRQKYYELYLIHLSHNQLYSYKEYLINLYIDTRFTLAYITDLKREYYNLHYIYSILYYTLLCFIILYIFLQSLIIFI